MSADGNGKAARGTQRKKHGGMLPEKQARAFLSNLRGWMNLHSLGAAETARNIQASRFTVHAWLDGTVSPCRASAEAVARNLHIPMQDLYGNGWCDIPPQAAKRKSLPGKQARAFCSNLRGWMRQHGLGTKDVAKNLGVTADSVRAWLGGDGLPSLKTTTNAARILGVPEHRLYERAWDDIQPRIPASESKALGREQARAFLSNLQAWAKQHGLGAADIVRNLRVKPYTIRGWLGGTRLPSRKTTTEIAATLGVPEHRLYERPWDDIQPRIPAGKDTTLDRKQARAFLSNLQAWAERNGFCQADIARNLCVKPYTLRGWLSGICLPSPTSTAGIAEALGVPEHRLCERPWDDIQPRVARYGRNVLPEHLMAKFLSNLKTWADQNGIRTTGISINLNASLPSVYRWLDGTLKPSYRAVSKAAAALGVPEHRLYERPWDDIRPHVKRRTLYVHETHAVIQAVLALTDRNKPLLRDVAVAIKTDKGWFARNANTKVMLWASRAEKVCAALGQTLPDVLSGNIRPENIPEAAAKPAKKPGKAPRTTAGLRISKTVLSRRAQDRALAIALSRPGLPLDRVSAASGLAVHVLARLAEDTSRAGEGEAKTAAAHALGPRAAEAILAGTVPGPETVSIPDAQGAEGNATEEEIRRRFRARLQEVRLASQWTQKGFAEALGQTYTWACHVEANRRNLSMNDVAGILSLAGCDLHGFLSGNDARFPRENSRGAISSSQVALQEENAGLLQDTLTRWMEEHRLSKRDAARAIGTPFDLVRKALRIGGRLRRGGVRKISSALGIPEEQVLSGPWPDPRTLTETISDEERSLFLGTLAGWIEKHRAAPYQAARLLSASPLDVHGWTRLRKGIGRNVILHASRTMGIPVEQVISGPWPDLPARNRGAHDDQREKFLETLSLWHARHRIPTSRTAAFLGASPLTAALWLRRQMLPRFETIASVAYRLGIPVEQACDGPWPDPPKPAPTERTPFRETLNGWIDKNRISINIAAGVLGFGYTCVFNWANGTNHISAASVRRIAGNLGIPEEQVCRGPWPDYNHAAERERRQPSGETLKGLAARRQRGRALLATMRRHGISVTALSLASGVDRTDIGALFLGTHPDADNAMGKVLAALGPGGNTVLDGVIAEIDPETARRIAALDTSTLNRRSARATIPA